jgi:hypothetical protein
MLADSQRVMILEDRLVRAETQVLAEVVRDFLMLCRMLCNDIPRP